MSLPYSQLANLGLYTYTNSLSAADSPAGSASIAMNVVCDKQDVLEGRRGFNYYSTYQFPLVNDFITKIYSYEDTMYVSYDAGKFAYDQSNNGNSWYTYPNFTMLPPTDGFIHQMLAGGNSYFTTNNGVYKISGVNTSLPVPAGVVQALDGTATATSYLSSGFLQTTSQCAYSIVWGYTDNSDLEVLGPPSQPIYLVNSASTSGDNVNCNLVFTIPPFVEQNSSLPWFYQIYRTPNTGSLTVPPGNNYQLVTQSNPTSTDYTNH